MAILRLVLGDQLSDDLSALDGLDSTADTVLMAEVRDEATYVRHHKQKIALVFAAMRNHAERLTARGELAACAHPLFEVVPGAIEPWEKTKDF